MQFRSIILLWLGLVLISFASRDGHVYTVNADDSARQRLVEGHSPHWSSDEQQLAYVYNGDLYLVNADGSNPVRLTDPPDAEHSPRWSPDGSRIAFLHSHEGEYYNTLYILTLLDRQLLKIEPGFQIVIGQLRWLPDGQALLFERIDPNARESGIYIARADGSALAHLADGQAPSWRP